MAVTFVAMFDLCCIIIFKLKRDQASSAEPSDFTLQNTLRALPR
jgi:hypothetical protein